MKTLRLDPELAEELERIARAEGISQSEFIRRAVRKACAEASGQTMADRLSYGIGKVRSDGGRAGRAHEAFGEIVLAKHQRNRR